MSKKEQTIHKFIRRNAMDQCLFGFIRGIRHNFANVTIEQAIEWFKRDFDLTEQELKTKSAVQTYVRMNKEFINMTKTINKPDHGIQN